MEAGMSVLSRLPMGGRRSGSGLATRLRMLGLFVLTPLWLVWGGGSCGTSVVPPPPSGSSATNDDNLAFRRPVILTTDHVLGNNSATLIVVMYEDYQSLACGKFVREQFPAIKTQYIDSGQIRWVCRHLPQAANNRAVPAARATECANEQGQFFDYRELVYDTVDDNNNQTILTDEMLKQHATTLGLDQTQFDDCFSGDTQDARIQQDRNSAAVLGFSGVPTFVVGTEIVTGVTTADKLTKIIDRHLNN